MGIERPRIRTLSVHEQAAWFRLTCASFNIRIVDGQLIARGTVHPTALNCTYSVRIEYRAPTRPRVWVEEPKLHPRTPEGRIPHTFTQNEPCLFLPGGNEWRSDKKIALTIVPWLSLWLFYYEVWLATGEWLGGGVHPRLEKDDVGETSSAVLPSVENENVAAVTGDTASEAA